MLGIPVWPVHPKKYICVRKVSVTESNNVSMRGPTSSLVHNYYLFILFMLLFVVIIVTTLVSRMNSHIFLKRTSILISLIDANSEFSSSFLST